MGAHTKTLVIKLAVDCGMVMMLVRYIYIYMGNVMHLFIRLYWYKIHEKNIGYTFDRGYGVSIQNQFGGSMCTFLWSIPMVIVNAAVIEKKAAAFREGGLRQGYHYISPVKKRR